jgi:predicted lactoylglutathione lyase
MERGMAEVARQMQSVSPVLLVRDVVKAAEYFRDKLGFSFPRYWGEPPAFCIPQREGVFVMLNQVAAGDEFEPNAAYDGRFDVYFNVRDADALHDEFKARGADIVCPPSDEPYMMREFQVRDVDGHLLAFAHDISRTGAS